MIQNTKRHILLENQELKRYVYELEETLNSIRNGEIDAIVVSGADGEKLYSLSSVETRYRIILEEMYEGAITLTTEGLITYCNSKFAELFSEPIEKIIGSYFFDLLDASEEKEFRRLLKAGLSGKCIGELTHKFKDGCTINFLLSISALPSEIDHGVCILFSDITELRVKEQELKHLNTLLELKVAERTADLDSAISDLWEEAAKRKLAEEELTKSLERFNLANQATFDVIWDWDIKTGFIWWNENFKTLYGYWDEDTNPGLEFWLTRIHPEDVNHVKTGIQMALDSDQTIWSDSYRLLCKDGSYADTEDRGYIVRDLQGNPTRMVGAMHDITDKKNYEKELVKAKLKAEESDRLKTAFLANMSHEIRTPLNGILGFSDLLKTPDLSDDEQHEFVDIIKKSSDRLLNIVNDILDISKIEAGLMELNLTKSDVQLLIEYIYSFFKPQAEKKDIKFSYKKGLAAKELFINTDSEKLIAILTNLVKNAIKFTDEGSIEFGYKTVETNNYLSLQFFVKDTGIGIPKGRQAAIFEPFIQSDIADKRAFQGTGLGLSIAKSYIEMLGGNLWVESKVGQGSKFYFTIPYDPLLKVIPDEKTVVPSKEKSAQSKKLKILITEDDKASQMLLTIACKEYSKVILKAGTGFEAIAACRNNPDIDLVLMDIKMPGLDGYEATRQIRRFNSDVVIIAQTAYGLSGDREKAIAAGCNDYISKPLQVIDLQEQISRHFGE